MSAIKDFFSALGDGAVWVTGKTLKRFAEALEKDRARLMGGCGIEIATSSGRFFSIKGGGGSAAAQTGPVIVRKIGDAWFAGVAPDYFLQQPIVPASTPVELSVSGKLSSLADDASGWMPTFENDEVWIEGTVTSLVADSAYVQNYGSSGSEGGGAIENDGVAPPSTNQSKFRIFLGKVVADGESLAFRPYAGKAHALGYLRGDSADSGGGNQTAITALFGFGM